MRRVRIRHVDAFTTVALEGNPAAVVGGDGEVFDDVAMQRIALNQHLSETVFLYPPESPENDAQVRIFTPSVELPFAGHPIIAAAHVLASEGRVSGARMLIETLSGVIPVEVHQAVAAAGASPRYTMTQRPPEFRESEFAPAEVAAWLGVESAAVLHVEHVSTGVWWLIAQLRSLEDVRRASPANALATGREISFFCLAAEGAEAAVHVRTFAPGAGIVEDPVTGSSHGCIGALIARGGLLPRRGGAIEYVAEQGSEIGQPGTVYVRVSGEGESLSVQVGGHAVTVLEGDLILP